MTAQPPSTSGKSVLMENLIGAIDVMLGRESGLKRMDCSNAGFLVSFAGLLLAGLIDASALSLIHGPRFALQDAPEGKLYFILGSLLVSLIAYGASLLTLYLVCRPPAEQVRIPTVVILHNWASPTISLAFLPLLLITGYGNNPVAGEPDTVANMLSVFWLGLLIFVGLRLMRIGLNVPFARAAALFALTTVVSLVCSQGLERLFGLGA